MVKDFKTHILEIGILAALVIIASANAYVGWLGTSVSFLYGLFLLSAYMLIKALLSRLSSLAAHLFFGCTVFLLFAEIISHKLLGLHLNRFALENLLQERGFNYIGVSPLVAGVIVVGFILCFSLVSRLLHARPNLISVPVTKSIILGLASVFCAQLLYGIAYYQGASTIMPVKRHMPFFASPHPYYILKGFGFILGDRHENPFGLSEIDAPISVTDHSGGVDGEFTLKASDVSATAPNIILVVTDSVRAQDIADMPDLMPNLLARKEDGHFSLEHLSVANCTHFSFYTMMSGKLPNGFGAARSTKKLVGLVPDLVKAGYATSSTESESLDWYDVSDIILPLETQRTVIGTENTITNDTSVTNMTLERVMAWTEETSAEAKPKFHLAYYNASHFPYGDGLNLLGDTSYERYLASIRLFDTEMGRLLSTLDQLQAWDNTIVIVTSDHGEEFMENGLVGHAGALTDYQVKVPFMVLGGSEKAVKVAKNIKSHLDIRPYLNSVIAPDIHSFTDSSTQYLARCDYDHPAEFIVIDANGEKISFDYDDGYLHPNNSGVAESAIDAAAQKLLARLKKDAQ